MSESDLRYTFACPACSSSFSISLERIPPVQARFSCPKCGKPMDFPSREEARVFIQLQASGGAPAAARPPAAAPPPPAPPKAVAASPSRPPDPAAPPAPPSRPAPATSSLDSTATETSRPEKTYRVDATGFERDVFDRRAMRTLIRTLAVNETSLVSVGDAVAVRASEIPELKSLFELRKTARATPPPVCRSHLEVVAHYVCGDTGRPLCEGCAPEKKFGGTSLRVCDHCGGTAKDLHDAPAEID
ncbi:MAG TPA: MJ0042-type zinc finger domain-containing protein [Thermoanaerobaculia bacterium]|nr:MJ0042-type zinc finger domain-containing protein [Thermoanaerobaculia bacterium]